MSEKRKRIHMLDEIRGFAILCMIVHHTFLDIGDLLGLEWGYEIFDRLCAVQPIFWGIFIIISGMCTRLSRNAKKRGLLVCLCALAITLVTAVIMPLLKFTGAEIYFGILHCLGVCMILVGLCMPIIEKIDYRIGAVASLLLFVAFCGIDRGTILLGAVDLPQSLYTNNIFAPLGFHSPAFYSADYFPVFPWIFLFFLGAFVGKLAKEEKLPSVMYIRHSKMLGFVGKNSLWFYLLHQPAIYVVLLIIAFIIA